MVNVLTNLTSSVYDPGDVILKFGERVSHLYVISEGACNLYKRNELDNN